MLAGASSKGRVDRCHIETSVRAAIWGDMEGVNKVVLGDGGGRNLTLFQCVESF